MRTDVRSFAVATSAALMLVVAGCSTDAGTSTTTPDVSATTSVAPSSTRESSSSHPSPEFDFSTLRIPDGAAAWPVRDVESCAEIGEVAEPRLVVRVPVADLQCVIYSNSNQTLIVASQELRLRGSGPSRAISGSTAEVREAMPSLSRAQVQVVQSKNPAAQYLVVLQGGGPTSDEVLTQAFST